MNSFYIALLAFGIFHIVFSMIISTKGMAASIAFKIIPFFSGVCSVVVGCYHLGIFKMFLE